MIGEGTLTMTLTFDGLGHLLYHGLPHKPFMLVRRPDRRRRSGTLPIGNARPVASVPLSPGDGRRRQGEGSDALQDHQLHQNSIPACAFTPERKGA